MDKLSRRNFLKGSAVAAAGAVVLGMAGCAAPSQGAGQGSGQGSAADIQWDETYDIVVAGGGLAGMAAAVSVATEGNGATCALLEKGPSTLGGGNSAFSGGCVFFTDKDHEKDCLDYLKWLRADYSTTPDDMLEAYAAQMTGILDFVKGLGAREEDMSISMPGKWHDDRGTEFVSSSFPEFPEVETSKCVGVFSFCGKEISTVSKFMLSVVEQHSDVITHKVNAPLVSLVQDPETKAIVGVVCDDNGKKINIKAEKGVIMCVGGFENNPTMKQDYLSMPKLYPVAGVQNTGDGIKICQAVGADMWHMNSCAGCWHTPEKIDGSAAATFYAMLAEKGIVVGKHGRRYYFDLCGLPVKTDWKSAVSGESTNIDTSVGVKHGHQNVGGEWPHMHLPSKSWFIVDSANKDVALTNLLTGEMLAEDVEADGWGFVSDTLAELAEKTGVPAEELERTVSEWNADCDRGFDSSFYRPAHWMTKVAEPPFYAVNLAPQFLNTDGGPVRNAKGQILDLEGNPIPNLYSSGEFGSLWCNVYQGGGNLSECIAFSRISVANALGLA